MKFVQLLDETIKTQKGTAVKRSKYGVGKDIGGFIYFHKNYVSDFPIPDDVMKSAVQKIDKFKYNLMKWNKKTNSLTFYNSKDFDTSNEPVAGEWITVHPDGTVKKGNEKQIYHHKWLWVKDDYRGFDVSKSMDRSKEWLAIKDVPFNRIGRKPFWIEFLNKNNLNEKWIGKVKSFYSGISTDMFENPSRTEINELMKKTSAIRLGITDGKKPKVYVWNGRDMIHADVYDTHEFRTGVTFRKPNGLFIDQDDTLGGTKFGFDDATNKIEALKILKRMFPSVKEIRIGHRVWKLTDLIKKLDIVTWDTARDMHDNPEKYKGK